MTPAAFLRLRPWLGAVVAIASVWAGIGLTRLEFDDSYRHLFRATTAEHDRMERAGREFGFDDSLLILFVESDDVLSLEALAAQRDIHRGVLEIEGVESVHSVLAVRRPRTGSRRLDLLFPPEPLGPEAHADAVAAALRHPLVVPHLVTADRRAALIVVRLDATLDRVEAIEPVLDLVRSVVRASTGSGAVTVSMTGLPALRVEIVRSVERDQLWFNLLGVSAACTVAFLIFRRFGPLVIAAAGPLAGVLWSMGLLGWAGERINPLNNVVPQLLLVIGFTDSTHYVFHLARSIRAGETPAGACVSVWRTLIPACLFTMLTTVIGFIPLAFVNVEAIRRFGLACATGSAISFAAVATVVPLLASTRVGSRMVTGLADRVPVWPLRIATWGLRRAWLVGTAGVLAVAVLAAVAWRLQPDYRYRENLPVSNAVFAALERADTLFGGISPVHVTIEWPETIPWGDERIFQMLTAVEDEFRREAAFTEPLSAAALLRAMAPDRPAAALPYLDAMPDGLRRAWVRPDLRTAVVTARTRDAGAASLAPVFSRFEEKIARLQARHPGFRLDLTGTAVVTARGSLQMIRDLGQGLGGAALGIVVLIGLGTRSWRLGLISILPNVIPLAGAAATLVWLGLPLQYIGAAAFSICLGLATDDSIHFLSSFRRHRAAGGSTEAAIRQTLHEVGSVIVTTTLLLGSGFATLMTSELPTVQLFGALSCAILLFAVAGDLLLMPALLKLGAGSCRDARSQAGSQTTPPGRE